MSVIQSKPISLTFGDFKEKHLKIADLTFDLKPRSMVMAPNESSYMISMCIIQIEALSLLVWEIFEENRIFDF